MVMVVTMTPVMPALAPLRSISTALGPLLISGLLPPFARWGDLVLLARLGSGCRGSDRSGRSVRARSFRFGILGKCRRTEQQASRCKTKPATVRAVEGLLVKCKT